MTGSLINDQQFIRNLTGIILENLRNENFGVRELANLSGLSPSGLNQRLHTILNRNITQFISAVRLQKALEMLQNEEVTASEVAFIVGFGSPAYFNTCFHKYFGYPPGKVKKRESGQPAEEIITLFRSKQKPEKRSDHTLILKISGMLLLAALIITIAVLIYSKFFSIGSLEDLRSNDGRIHVAVMPFNNLTNDNSYDVWQIGIQENLISYLSNNPDEIIILQKDAVISLFTDKGLTEYNSISLSGSIKISQRLKSDILITGSISRSDSIIRINAHLINSKTGEAVKAFQIDGSAEGLLPVIDSLSVQIRSFLLISIPKKENSETP